MKKSILIQGLFLFITTFAFAQNDTISNGGMENWHSTTYSDPDHWSTLNSLTDFGYPPSTTRTNDSHSGQYAAMLQTMSGQFSDIPGVLASGPVLDASGNPDFSKIRIAFKSRPLKFRFYYKAIPSTGDTCIAVMILTRWDSAYQKTDTVGMARFQQSNTINSYTLADIDFSYRLPYDPDSSTIAFSSSINAFSPIVGSTFYIDDISVVYDNTGVNNALETFNSINVYPNPFVKNCTINFDSQEKGNLNISIIDLQGRAVLETSMDVLIGNNTKELTEIASLSKGMYFLKATMNNHTQIVKVLKSVD